MHIPGVGGNSGYYNTQQTQHQNTQPNPANGTGSTPQADHLAQKMESLRQQLNVGSIDSNTLLQELQRHSRHDRTLEQDGLNMRSYSDRRRIELEAIPGGEHVAAQYGLSVSRSKDMNSPALHHLRANTGSDGIYQTGDSGNLPEKVSAELFRRKFGTQGNLAYVHVNSPHSARSILNLYQGTPHMAGLTTEQFMQSERFQKLGENVYTLIMDKTPKGQTNLLEAMPRTLTDEGARPTMYDMMAEFKGAVRPRQQDPSINNQALIHQLRGTPGNSVSQRLREIPNQHSTGPLAHTAAELIDNLVTMLDARGSGQQLRHDVLLANGLQALTDVADSLPSLAKDGTAIFATGYHALLEELQVCLSAARPYDVNDFRQAASPLVAPDQLPPSVPTPEVHLMSSGTSALTTALRAARHLTGSNQIEYLAAPGYNDTPIYPDLEKHLQKNFQVSGNAPIIVASLGDDSSPRLGSSKGWDGNAVIAGMRERFKAHNGTPLTLVLDATMENRGDMDKVVGSFGREIAAGQLRILSCTSYQKQTGLGNPKATGGGIGLISVNDKPARQIRASLANIEQGLNRLGGNDTQLLTHMLISRERAFDIKERAVATAQTAQQMLFSGTGVLGKFAHHQPNSSIASFTKDNSQYTFFTDSMKQGAKRGLQVKCPIDGVFGLCPQHVEMREGSGYTQTTASLKGDQIRLAFGQESPAELTEALQLVSILQSGKMNQWNAESIVHMATTLLDIPKPDFSTQADKDHRLGNALAQKLIDIDREANPLPPKAQIQNSAELRQRELANANDFRIHSIVSGVMGLGISTYLANHQANKMPLANPHTAMQGTNRRELDYLLYGLVHSGMPHVSMNSKLAIMDVQATVCADDMKSHDPAIRRQGLETLADAGARLQLSSNPEYFFNIPEPVFNEADDEMKQHLVQSMLGHMEAHSQLLVAERLYLQGQHVKLQSVLRGIEANAAQGPLLGDSTYSNRDQQLASNSRLQLQVARFFNKLG
ncbi:hypothetical protein ACKC9G_12360 [Pokkaliibacter sp. CJK22405]|uniref:hypothetical protein n=1 Tax=Pokkaliibacter sp. CJK22405 TaxID=3384615 RepID=UPI003984817D